MRLTKKDSFDTISLAVGQHFRYAGIAQPVEQLICNQQVGGSNPSTSSTTLYGGVPEWPKGADCKSVAFRFGGSNPPSSTKNPECFRIQDFYFSLFTTPKADVDRCAVAAPLFHGPVFPPKALSPFQKQKISFYY